MNDTTTTHLGAFAAEAAFGEALDQGAAAPNGIFDFVLDVTTAIERRLVDAWYGRGEAADRDRATAAAIDDLGYGDDR